MCIIITTNVRYFGVIRMDQDNLRLIDGPSQTLADMSINFVIFKYKFGTIEQEEIISISISALLPLSKTNN